MKGKLLLGGSLRRSDRRESASPWVIFASNGNLLARSLLTTSGHDQRPCDLPRLLRWIVQARPNSNLFSD